MNEFQSYNCLADRLISVLDYRRYDVYNPLKTKYSIAHLTRDGLAPFIR